MKRYPLRISQTGNQHPYRRMPNQSRAVDIEEL